MKKNGGIPDLDIVASWIKWIYRSMTLTALQTQTVSLSEQDQKSQISYQNKKVNFLRD